MKFLLCCPNSYEVLPAFKLGPSPPDSLHLRALEVRMDGRRKALTQDCATAHFSDKQFVLPASMAEYFWEVTSGYFVFKSHIELRIMVSSALSNFFLSFSWAASITSLNLYLPVALFVWISGVFSQLLQPLKLYG